MEGERYTYVRATRQRARGRSVAKFGLPAVRLGQLAPAIVQQSAKGRLHKARVLAKEAVGLLMCYVTLIGELGRRLPQLAPRVFIVTHPCIVRRERQAQNPGVLCREEIYVGDRIGTGPLCH